MIHKLIVILSLMGSVAAIVLGVISYRRALPHDKLWIDSFTKSPKAQYTLVRGTIHVVYAEPLKKLPTEKAETGFAGFYVKSNTIGNTFAQGFGVPFWMVALLLLTYPAIALKRGPLRRRRRRKRGLCIHCGYNLTGLSSNRCPECGYGIASATGRSVDTSPAGT